MVPLFALLDGIAPPAEHRLEDDRKSDEEQPWRRPVDAEQVELATAQIAHIADAAEGDDEGADGRQQRPRSRIDNVVVVIFLLRIGHVRIPEYMHARRFDGASSQSFPLPAWTSCRTAAHPDERSG